MRQDDEIREIDYLETGKGTYLRTEEEGMEERRSGNAIQSTDRVAEADFSRLFSKAIISSE